MILPASGVVMLLSEPYFKTFTTQAVCDTSTATEGLFAVSCESPEEVNDLVKKAIAAGGRHAMDPLDHGFMYGWSFYDLDGHHWEVLWMDPAAIQPPAEAIEAQQ
jgi:predicted lactoylglutathione lyase